MLVKKSQVFSFFLKVSVVVQLLKSIGNMFHEAGAPTTTDRPPLVVRLNRGFWRKFLQTIGGF